MIKSNNKFLFYRILVFSLFSLVFLINYCTTSPQTGTLTGTVQLSGQTNHSEIIVALYELSELDPDILDINTKYPHIGVIINQTTEFDHRFANLTKYTETDANGNFKIKDIPTGRYNFMALKDSFGFRYIYEVTITEGENELNSLKTKDHQPEADPPMAERPSTFVMTTVNKKIKEKNFRPKLKKNNFNFLPFTFNLKARNSDLTLFPVTYISSDIDTATTWHSWQNYIIENDIFVSGALTIAPGAIIRLNEGVKLTISGDLTAIGEKQNMIWFTSNHGFDNVEFLIINSQLNSKFKIQNSKLREIAPFNRIELTSSPDKSVSYCKFDYASTGLLSNVNGFSISNCIFRNSACGFKSENVDSAFCKNLLCENITNESEGGIYFYQVDEGCIEKNIINQGYNGMKIKNECNPKIKNNYISNCDYGLDISYYSDPIIKFNEIGNCDFGIYISYYSSSNIEKINFDSEVCIKSYKLYNNSPEIHNNNLKFDLYSFQIGWKTYEGLNSENNYFYTINTTEIEESIFDKNDVESSQQQYYGEVYYNPFLTEEYPYTGIQEE